MRGLAYICETAHNRSMKAVIWMGSSKDDLIAFPPDARREAGYQLDRVQRGDEPEDWKPMSTVGASVREIRIRELSGALSRDLSGYSARRCLRTALFSEK